MDEPSTSTALASATKKLSMNNSKVAPIISKATLISKSNTQPAGVKPPALGFKPYTVSSAPSTSKPSAATSKPTNSVASKDNKKSDNKKSEEKLKQKAEKEAKKVNSGNRWRPLTNKFCDVSRRRSDWLRRKRSSQS